MANIGSIVVPLFGLYLGSYKVIQKGTTMERMGSNEKNQGRRGS